MKENHPVLTPGLVQEMDAIMTHYQHDTSKLLEILLGHPACSSAAIHSKGGCLLCGREDEPQNHAGL